MTRRVARPPLRRRLLPERQRADLGTPTHHEWHRPPEPYSAAASTETPGPRLNPPRQAIPAHTDTAGTPTLAGPHKRLEQAASEPSEHQLPSGQSGPCRARQQGALGLPLFILAYAILWLQCGATRHSPEVWVPHEGPNRFRAKNSIAVLRGLCRDAAHLPCRAHSSPPWLGVDRVAANYGLFASCPRGRHGQN